MMLTELNLMLEQIKQVEDWQGYINRNPELKTAIKIMKKLKKYGQVYIVGGAVRDIVLGENPDDIDIATNAPIEKIQKEFRTHDIGRSKDFGIVVINQGGFQYEIAQFRKDGTYTDGRRPDEVVINVPFEEDAGRRDFTINAMGIDANGNIIDYFDGQGDIKNKVIKTVGDPEQRFGEDSLRLLRAVRFASRLGFKIDPATSKAMKKLSPKIKKVSWERISKELMKMAAQSGDKFANALIILEQVGLLEHILPEITKMHGFKHTPETHPEGLYVRRILS